MLQYACFDALAEQVAGRVHASAADDPIAAERHRAFMLTHLSLGALPFAALPALLALGAPPSGAGLAAFAWLTAPILIALDLSRTGALDRSLVAIAAAFAALVAFVALATGGLASPALAMFALPAIDAALAGSRRGVIGAGLAALGGLMAVAALSAADPALRPTFEPSLAAAGFGVAAVYGLALAARALRVSQALDRADRPSVGRFELLASSIDDLVTRHAPNGSATFASPAAWPLLGAPPRDLMDQGLFARIHIADRPAFLQAIASAAEGAVSPVVELRLRRETETNVQAYRWVEMRARPVRPHEADEMSAAAAPVVAVFRDANVRKAYEEALVSAREEAERANLAKTRFLAHMSHELRTPLNAIIGFSEVLSDEKLCRLTPERRADYAALIHRSGAHLLEVVNSILDMAKIESGAFTIAPRPCALGPLVEHCVSLMALRAEAAGVALVAEAAADLPEVEADPRAVTQVLLNLIANAVKFTPRGGEAAVSLTARRGGVALVVRDTGVGIAPENIGRLGEAFYQVEGGYGRQAEGAGLGLSVVRGLIKLHGGEIAVESALGRGTAVTVFLPCVAESAGVDRLHEASGEKVKRRA